MERKQRQQTLSAQVASSTADHLHCTYPLALVTVGVFMIPMTAMSANTYSARRPPFRVIIRPI